MLEEMQRLAPHGASGRSLVRYAAASSLIAMILSALTIYNGPSVIDAPTDVFVLIGGAWRMLLGQIPHVDFHNPIGALTYGFVEAGMAIGGAETLGFPWAATLLLAVAAIWASAVAYSRLEPWLAFGFVVFIALLCVATRPLGYAPDTHSYAMLYNRIAWVWLSILTLQAFIEPRRAPARTALDAASLGVLLGLLFYTKITFAIFGGLALALAMLLRPDLRRLRSLAAAGAGLAASILAVWAATGAAPLAYLADIAAAGGVQSPEARVRWLLGALKFGVIPLALVSLAWAAIVGRRILTRRRLDRQSLAVTLQFAFLCGAGLALTTTNAGERGEVPLYAMAGLILLHNRALALDDRSRRPALAGAFAATALIALFIGARDALSIADTTAMRAYRVAEAPAGQRLAAPRLHNFVIPHTSAHATQIWRGAVLPPRVNDGLGLLRQHVDGDARLMVFALSDMFSFPLSLTPPTGGPLWWDRNFNYNLDHYPPAEQVFADVTHVMIPQIHPEDGGCCKHVVGDLEQMYGPHLRAHFVEVGRTQTWVLYQRR
jgi:hypothetical protein